MSPFRSEKQRKFMWAKHPKIARRWAHEGRSKRGKRGVRRYRGKK